AALPQRCIQLADGKEARAPIEIQQVSRLGARPAAVGNTLCEHAIEYQTARGGQYESALGGPQVAQWRGDAQQIGPCTPEALRPEIVGDPESGDPLQPLRERRSIHPCLTDTDLEAIRGQRATR